MDRKTWLKQLTRELALALAGVTLIGAPLFVRAVSQEMEPPAVLAKATVNRTEAPPDRLGEEPPLRCGDCHDAWPAADDAPIGFPAGSHRPSPPSSSLRE